MPTHYLLFMINTDLIPAHLREKPHMLKDATYTKDSDQINLISTPDIRQAIKVPVNITIDENATQFEVSKETNQHVDLELRNILKELPQVTKDNLDDFLTTIKSNSYLQPIEKETFDNVIEYLQKEKPED